MKAIEQIIQNIENSKSYVLEAGAGSGKTYTLIQTLNYLIEQKSDSLKKFNQKIVCITYTNVAKNEINKRIENNDLVFVSTIHEFLWGTIKQYQKQLKVELCTLNETNVQKDIDKGKLDSKYIPNLTTRINLIDKVIYNDTSFNDFENGLIEHDDVIEITRLMYQNYPLLTDIVAAKYPYIFVDEYQDTAEDTIFCLIDLLLSRNLNKIMIGFYGDSHQKIYDYGIGDLSKYYIDNGGLIELVKKEENYRSSTSIVHLLNKFRTNIQQVPQTDFVGSAKFIYWRNHPVKPKTKIREFNESLKEPKNKFYDDVVRKLLQLGWNFQARSKDKILVLANSRVAQRAGFGNLFAIFSRRFGQSTKEKLLDRTHPLIALFLGTIDKKTSQERRIGLEHLIDFWESGNQNNVIRFIRKNGVVLNGAFIHSHKKHISDLLTQISNLRQTFTIREVFDFVTNNGLLSNKRFTEYLLKIGVDIESVKDEEKERLQKDKELLESFMNLPYSELLSLWKHTQDNTVFSTKHGTKGDEYRNVLTVIDDTEWVQEYNFKNFFNNSEEKPERCLRTRNLFYVECSRAKQNLVVLALSDMDEAALNNINLWFGAENVICVEDF